MVALEPYYFELKIEDSEVSGMIAWKKIILLAL